MQYSLKELRARKGLSQKKVAQDNGISAATYNAWERDVSNVAIIKVDALAKYYGVNLHEIDISAKNFTDKLTL